MKHKKKIIGLLLTSILLLGMLGTAAAAQNEVSVLIDGSKLSFSDVSPEIVDGKTFVPVRGVFEKMNAAVDYIADTQTVTISCNNVNIDFVIGSDSVAVTKDNKKEIVKLENATYIKNDRTLVPLRFIAETVGYDVDWNGDITTVSITTNIKKALELITSFTTGDKSAAEKYLTDGYIQHNLAFGTGKAAFIAAVEGLASAPVKTTVNNIRSFADGDYVFLQTVYNFAGAGEQVGYDIFRFENGKIAEHWDNLAAVAEPNPSGHTQIDGTTVITDLDKTEANKAVVAGFVGDVLRGENPNKITTYIEGDNYIQHNTTIADGLSGLGAALAYLAENGIEMVYTKTYMVLGQGNFVLVASEGTFGGVPTAYYDLFRVENSKIVEHWDVMEGIMPEADRANTNGKF